MYDSCSSLYLLHDAPHLLLPLPARRQSVAVYPEVAASGMEMTDTIFDSRFRLAE